MKPLILMALVTAGAAQAQTAGPCGGQIDVVNGLVVTKTALVGTAKEDACVKAVGEKLAADPDVQGVTVELRTLDDQRVGGKALKTATRVAEVLVSGGLAKEKVYAVVPRADGEEQGLKIVVRFLPPGLPTVQILKLHGQALAGRDETKLEARRPGAGLSVRDVFVTRSGGALLSFPDFGNVQLFADSMIQVLPVTAKGVPAFALVRGRAFVQTLPSGNGLELVLDPTARIDISPASRADVTRGTDKWTASIYDGKAEFLGKDATVGVDAGNGLSGQGALVGTPKPLLPAPKALSTFGKPLEGELKWEKVPNASRYRLEVAHDAGFGPSTVAQTAAAESSAVDPSVGSGKFFFRVFALDDADVPGATSKVYSFTR